MKTQSNRDYPWDQWTNGMTWQLRQGEHFASSVSRFVREAQSRADALGLRCEIRKRDKWVVMRFFKPGDTAYGY